MDNWIQIDKYIYSLINIVKDKETLIKEVRSKYKWTEKQAHDACDPLIRRSNVEEKWNKSGGTISKVEKGPKKKKLKKR